MKGAEAAASKGAAALFWLDSESRPSRTASSSEPRIAVCYIS